MAGVKTTLVPCRLVGADRVAYTCPECKKANTPTLATCHVPGGWGSALGVYRYSTCIYCRTLLPLSSPAVEPKKGHVLNKTTQDATQALHPPPLPT